MQRSGKSRESKTKKHKSAADVAFAALTDLVVAHPNDDHRQSIQLFIDKYGAKRFIKRANQQNVPIRNYDNSLEKYQFPITRYVSLLSFVCSYGRTDMIEALLLAGVDANSGFDAADTGNHDVRALTIACTLNRVDVVKLLLAHDVDILIKDRTNSTILSDVNDFKICDLLLNHARDKKILPKFLTIVVIATLLNVRKYIMAKHLLEYEDLAKAIDIKEFTRDMAVLAYKPSSICVESVKLLRMIVQRYNPHFSHAIPKSSMELSATVSHVALFGTSMPSGILNKAAALKKANAQIYALLSGPSAGLPYLKHLESELERYFAHRHPNVKFQHVNRHEFSTVIIEGLALPIPKQDSSYFTRQNSDIYQKKYSALKELLLLLFRKHGIGEQAIKWMGFVATTEANAGVERGDFIIESNAVGATLVHGALSHMLQAAIILLAIERGDIDLAFDEDGKMCKLTVKELFASQVAAQKIGEDNKLWTSMRDQRVPDFISFCDPHKLQSVIMTEGERLGLKKLSSYLTHSFGKALVKFHRTFKTYNPGLADFDEFIAVLSMMRTAQVQQIQPMLDHGVNKYVRQTKDKEKDYLISSMGKFATAQVRHYQPSTTFVLRDFAAPAPASAPSRRARE